MSTDLTHAVDADHHDAGRSMLSARIDATENGWTGWFDALRSGTVYEDVGAAASPVRELTAGITQSQAREPAAGTGTRT